MRDWPAPQKGAKNDHSVEMSMPLTNSTTLSVTPADELFVKVKEILSRMTIPKTEAEIATDLQVSKRQTREWLRLLVKEGVLKKKQKPLRYFVPSERQEHLFGNTHDS